MILVETEERRPLPAGSYLLIDSWAPGLPLSRGERLDDVAVVRKKDDPVLLRGIDLRDLEVRSASRVSLEEGADVSVVLQGTSGPLIARGRKGDVSFVHLAFSTDPDNASLALLPAFPLLVKDAAAPLLGATGSSAPAWLRTGATFALDGVLRGAGPLVATRLDPPGGSTELRVVAGGTRAIAPSRPGRVVLRRGEGEVECGVAICDRATSDVFPVRAEGPRITRRAARTHREFRDLSRFFWLGAVVLLLVEWGLFHGAWTR